MNLWFPYSLNLLRFEKTNKVLRMRGNDVPLFFWQLCGICVCITVYVNIHFNISITFRSTTPLEVSFVSAVSFQTSREQPSIVDYKLRWALLLKEVVHRLIQQGKTRMQGLLFFFSTDMGLAVTCRTCGEAVLFLFCYLDHFPLLASSFALTYGKQMKNNKNCVQSQLERSNKCLCFTWHKNKK